MPARTAKAAIGRAADRLAGLSSGGQRRVRHDRENGSVGR
ncbi:hypothetical protein BURMUCF2_B0403 [Burkholderia multivorans CF2]|nr:hypothetical protein BURMUCF2_B0403 [Burkholderia multivorans CF2]